MSRTTSYFKLLRKVLFEFGMSSSICMDGKKKQKNQYALRIMTKVGTSMEGDVRGVSRVRLLRSIRWTLLPGQEVWVGFCVWQESKEFKQRNDETWINYYWSGPGERETVEGTRSGERETVIETEVERERQTGNMSWKWRQPCWQVGCWRWGRGIGDS